MKTLINAFTPNAFVPSHIMRFIGIAWIGIFLASWVALALQYPILATPPEVFRALSELWLGGIAEDIIVSLRTNVEALVISAFISFSLAYMTAIPALRPAVAASSTARFLGLTGFLIVLIVYFGGGHWLKVFIIVFGMTPYMVVSMAAAVASIPREQFDHARTIRFSEWRIVWEVIIRGQAHNAGETLRQCAAIGWMMLTMVEGLQRSEGGLGKMLLDSNKHLKLDKIFAIQLIIFSLGLLIDIALKHGNRKLFKHAYLKLERR